MTQHRVLDLKRGSSAAAGDESGKPSNEQMHQEEDHAAPILRTPTKAQIRVSDPYTRKGGGGDPETWKLFEIALRQAGKSEEEIAKDRKQYMGVADAAFEQLLGLVPEDVINAIGTGQKARERTLIYGGAGDLRSRRLGDFREAAQTAGRHGAVDRLAAAEEKLAHYGFF